MPNHEIYYEEWVGCFFNYVFGFRMFSYCDCYGHDVLWMHYDALLTCHSNSTTKVQLWGWSQRFFMHLICIAVLDDSVQVTTELPFDALQLKNLPLKRTVLNFLAWNIFFETHNNRLQQFQATISAARVHLQRCLHDGGWAGWAGWAFHGWGGRFVIRGSMSCISSLLFVGVFCGFFHLDFSCNFWKCSVPILVLCSMDSTVYKTVNDVRASFWKM